MQTKPSEQKLATAAFAFFSKDGGQHEIVEVIDFRAKPFVVRVRGKGWIPVNVIVFGDDAEHAQKRVFEQLRYVSEHAADDSMSQERAMQYLAGLASGELRMECEPFPLQLISKVQWATNGGCL